MKNSFVSVLVAGFLATMVVSECPNACSAHGKCGAYDMCTCYRNWMSNDCSERICQFGLAHVDTPKGDLDASSGKLSDADTIVVSNDAMYPYGTTEQYPYAGDIDGLVLQNTAHEYRECSNKGICDRVTGTCACFEGYDGSACQRASCPVTDGAMCAGHGTCHTIEELAKMDHGNIYELWDASSTMGCKCDPGYTGADCSQKVCKWGTDPLYYDSGSVARYSNWTYQFYSDSANTVAILGNYSIIFYDAHGEDWQTEPIDWDATCETVVAALEGLPNDVIPSGSVRCFKEDGDSALRAPIYDATKLNLHNRYTVAFPGNPGKLKQMEITKHLDGTRPTLYSDETTSTLGWHIYANGHTGEDVDMVPDLCEGVLVTLAGSGSNTYLNGIDEQEAKALKRCLGSSDSTDDNNVEVYNWDYGGYFNPHLIKLVDQTQYTSTVFTNGDIAGQVGTVDINTDAGTAITPVSLLCNPNDINAALYGDNVCSNKNSPGFYAVLYYATGLAAASSPWQLLSQASIPYSTTTLFKVYTTKGYLQLVNPYAAVYSRTDAYSDLQQIDSYYTSTLHVTNTSGMTGAVAADWFGWMDCETQAIGSNGNLACLNKNDYVMLLAANGTNAVYPNMYQISKLNRAEKNWGNDPQITTSQDAWFSEGEKIRTTITLDKSVNQDFYYDGGQMMDGGSTSDTSARVYKFFPDTSTAANGYAYAGECSHRGVCNQENGLCECFGGYTNDNCDTINALAL
jgi:hypothetical protein